MKSHAFEAAFAALAASALMTSAHAGLAFSFSDPVPGKQLFNTQANQAGPGTGILSYDSSVPIGFFVDGSTEPNAFTHLWSNARMEMSMTLYAGSTVGGIFSAPVVGYFRIFDATSGLDILRGDASGGTFLRVSGTSSILLSSDSGFNYTFGAQLLSTLAATGNGGRLPTDAQEGVFTLTDAVATGGGSLIGAGGVVRSFEANASFSGNAATTPAPGALALLALSGLAGRRRRA